MESGADISTETKRTDLLESGVSSNTTQIQSGHAVSGVGPLPNVSDQGCAVIFHIFFKVVQVLLYILASNDSVTIFVIVAVFAVVDFWTVKNVTGRMIVGLRWWTVTDETGKDIHYFENYDFPLEGRGKHNSAFWTAQLGITLFWLTFVVLDLIRFKFFWLCLAVIGGFLSSINTYFFYKARQDHQSKISSAFNGVKNTVATAMFLNRFGGSN